MTLVPELRDDDIERRILDARPRLEAFLRRLSGQDAEDLAQETLARAWRYRGSLDAERDVEPWLMKTAFRTFLDNRERGRRQPQKLGEHLEQIPDARPRQTDLDEEIAHLLRPLSPIEHAVTVRFHQHGESLADIAAALALPLGTVKSHLHRARRKLAREGGRR